MEIYQTLDAGQSWNWQGAAFESGCPLGWRGLTELIDPAPVDLLGRDGQTEPLLQRPGADAPHDVWPPAGGVDDLRNGRFNVTGPRGARNRQGPLEECELILVSRINGHATRSVGKNICHAATNR